MADSTGSHGERVSYEDFGRRAANVRAAMAALGAAVDASGLDKGLTELVKLRASQINGCAFCIQYHLSVMRKLGVPAAKIDLLPAWREAGIYSPREKAALAWTETLTAMGPESAPDAIHAQVLEQFSPEEALFLTVAIGTINQWNRIAVGLRFAPHVAAS
ncbi:MAG: carboxymuconolactone decarboxylase family protein [Hyphomicrobiaceae bacterium]|nr:carboxymuconolactone decarboxylase family protein [Hyphomicrobiaceae bacterium]